MKAIFHGAFPPSSAVNWFVKGEQRDSAFFFLNIPTLFMRLGISFQQMWFIKKFTRSRPPVLLKLLFRLSSCGRLYTILYQTFRKKHHQRRWPSVEPERLLQDYTELAKVRQLEMINFSNIYGRKRYIINYREQYWILQDAFYQRRNNVCTKQQTPRAPCNATSTFIAYFIFSTRKKNFHIFQCYVL